MKLSRLLTILSLNPIMSMKKKQAHVVIIIWNPRTIWHHGSHAQS